MTDVVAASVYVASSSALTSSSKAARLMKSARQQGMRGGRHEYTGSGSCSGWILFPREALVRHL